MHFLKFTVSDLKIQWHYTLYNSGGTYKARYLVMDPIDTNNYYIMGMMNSVGGILRL